MSKKEKCKRTSILFVIWGILALLIGSIGYGQLSDESSFEHWLNGTYDDLEACKDLCTLAIIVGVILILLAIVFAVIASIQSDETTTSHNNNYRENSDSGDNSWRCPVCSTVNASYVGTCGCGARKPLPNNANLPLEDDVDYWLENSPVCNPNIEKEQPSVDYWSCPKCNRVNAGYATCTCGEFNPSLKDSSVVLSPPKVVVEPSTKSIPKQQTIGNSIQKETENKPYKCFCPYCGEKMTERTVFCCVCGQKLK